MACVTKYISRVHVSLTERAVAFFTPSSVKAGSQYMQVNPLCCIVLQDMHCNATLGDARLEVGSILEHDLA